MAGIQTGPIPTQLTLLSDLQKYRPGSKVRFLGCVTHYSLKAAVLTLRHNYPKGNSIKADVDVKLLVNTLRSNETRIGEWVNVMGYITRNQTQDGSSNEFSLTQVQAIVLWPSGPLNLAGYEQSLSQQSASRGPSKSIS